MRFTTTMDKAAVPLAPFELLAPRRGGGVTGRGVAAAGGVAADRVHERIRHGQPGSDVLRIGTGHVRGPGTFVGLGLRRRRGSGLPLRFPTGCRLPKRPSEGRGWFRGVRRWLVFSVVGVAFVAVTIVLRAVTPGPRNDYDILFSLGTLLIILGVFLTGWAARRQHLK